MDAYLDYNATTPVAEEVKEAMIPWFSEKFWNASSSHNGGRTANNAVENARQQIADLIGANPSEIFFTSGSTESINLAIKGTFLPDENPGSFLTSQTEHKAVLDTASVLSQNGIDSHLLPVNELGEVQIQELSNIETTNPKLVSFMAANNETGVITDLDKLVTHSKEIGALFHCDATQAIGKIDFDVEDLNIDMASISAHKMYGPKGVGALYCRRGAHINSLIDGGGHEKGLRSGTLNVPGIVGFGMAAELSSKFMQEDSDLFSELIEKLLTGLQAQINDIAVIAEDSKKLPNTLNIRFKEADAEAIMANAQSVMVSSGSACTARVPEASHVLVAMGMTQEEASECLRFSVGRYTTVEEVNHAVAEISAAVKRVRELNK